MISRSSRSGTRKALIKTFTYFIPSPPARRTGYRETEYDKIMQGILTSGFELIDLRTEAVESGVFLIAVVKAANKKVFQLDVALDMHEKYRLKHSHSSPDILLEDEDDA